MDGGEWAEEVSEECDEAQQRARERAELDGRRGEAQIQMGKYFGKQTPTGPLPKPPAMTHPAPPESNHSFISSNKIALSHCLLFPSSFPTPLKNF